MRSKPVYAHQIIVDESYKARVTAEVGRWNAAGKPVPSWEELDEIASFLGEARASGELSAAMKKIQLPPGIGVIEFSKDLVMVYWEGDPIAHALINAGIEDLPVLLADENINIRELAKLKLDMLLAKGGDA